MECRRAVLAGGHRAELETAGALPRTTTAQTGTAGRLKRDERRQRWQEGNRTAGRSEQSILKTPSPDEKFPILHIFHQSHTVLNKCRIGLFPNGRLALICAHGAGSCAIPLGGRPATLNVR